MSVPRGEVRAPRGREMADEPSKGITCRGVAAGVLTVGSAVAASASTPVGTDTAVTVDQAYVKANGRPITSADAISACGANRRQQNEPSTAVDPRSPNIVVAGSNDYCTVEMAGGTWTGFYRSTTSGTTWVDSLLPGYPTDTSPEGSASPLQQRGISNAGDPVQAWDNNGRLFYMGNAFNRAQPQNGSVWVATYDQDAAHYVRTVIVGSGTPALNGPVQRQDLDRGRPRREQPATPATCTRRGASSRGSAATTRSPSSRSTDHGATFSQPMKISTGSKNVQFADIAVTSNGTVYVAYRQFETNRGHQENSIRYVVSTDGGRSFSQAGDRGRLRALRRGRLRRRPGGGRRGARGGVPSAPTAPSRRPARSRWVTAETAARARSPARADSSSSATTASRGSPPTRRPPTRTSTSSTTRPSPAPSRTR